MRKRIVKTGIFGTWALLAALGLGAAPAWAFDVSEATVNQVIAAKLADKRFDDLQLSSPRITLLEGEATFCTDARPKIYPRDISFCAGLTPKWRQESATLVASRMSLLSLSVRGIDPQQIELVRVVLNQGILPALEGIELYRADSAIAKQISGVRVRPGRIELDM
jgi:hypothetical protein